VRDRLGYRGCANCRLDRWIEDMEPDRSGEVGQGSP
jgi:hypothetical protein